MSRLTERLAVALAALAVLAALTACAPVSTVAVPAGAAPGDTPIAALTADVTYLASPALGGRAAGMPGGDSATAFLVRRYLRLGLRGPFRAACDTAPVCRPALLQRIEVGGLRTHNVAALVVGTDSALRGEYVVVGAHYDHIGRSPTLSLDPERGDVVRPGADDNASGTAAVLELARRLADHAPRRSVLLVHFGAEELGLVGSQAFVAHPPVPVTAMTLMVNLDMVGRLRGSRLIVDARGSPGLRALVDSAARLAGVRTSRVRVDPSRSDQGSFLDRGVPTVMLFTDFHEDYHRATDVAARIDYPGLSRVVDVAERVVRTAADGGW